MTDVASLLPGAERFDGQGGAIATWVRETYSLSRYSTMVASPRATEAFAYPVSYARVAPYDAYERCLRAGSRVLSRQIGKPLHVVYNRLLWDRFWVRSAFRHIGDARLIQIHNRPHYARLLREAGYRGRIMLHMHNDLRSYVNDAEAEMVFSHIDSIAFCSAFIMDRALEHFRDLPRTVAIPNGVSSTQIDRFRESRTDAPLRLIYAGRIMPEKGPLEAVEVCVELRRRGIDARIDLVGGTGSGSDNSPTPYLAMVESAVRDLNETVGVEVARLLGPRPHPEVFRLFEEGDLFVLPSAWEEPFGMVALEAMAKGCVPFVSAKGGLPEVVRDGGVVISNTSESKTSVVSAFADAVEEHLAPDALDRLRLLGWDRASELTWERVAESADQEFERELASL
ncbi:glycosyltransferase family 4 protein [Microbacterium sp. NPDC056052]|uniref:glycosyltransferase family 4 protein n=1 Tax=Microbacterium sp. NPDC056052 TaxID=3345695 RepID=UPI0035D87308